MYLNIKPEDVFCFSSFMPFPHAVENAVRIIDRKKNTVV